MSDEQEIRLQRLLEREADLEFGLGVFRPGGAYLDGPSTGEGRPAPGTHLAQIYEEQTRRAMERLAEHAARLEAERLAAIEAEENARKAREAAAPEIAEFFQRWCEFQDEARPLRDALAPIETASDKCVRSLRAAAGPTSGDLRAKYGADEIDLLGRQGKAFGPDADGHYSYPIADAEDLHNVIVAAVQPFGSTQALRAYIRRRAEEVLR